jgi:enoyl-CoA hydratase/carnithine racemase
VNAVVAKEELSAFALARATALATKPAGSVLLAKKLLREPHRAELKAVIAREGVHFIERLGSAEAAEAFQAFFTRKRS